MRDVLHNLRNSRESDKKRIDYLEKIWHQIVETLGNNEERINNLEKYHCPTCQKKKK